jgi:hypothetical protein
MKTRYFEGSFVLVATINSIITSRPIVIYSVEQNQTGDYTLEHLIIIADLFHEMNIIYNTTITFPAAVYDEEMMKDFVLEESKLKFIEFALSNKKVSSDFVVSIKLDFSEIKYSILFVLERNCQGALDQIQSVSKGKELGMHIKLIKTINP